MLLPSIRLRQIFAEPLGKYVIDSHVLKIKRLLAIEASSVIGLPKSITLAI
jgi:hypothetical protein